MKFIKKYPVLSLLMSSLLSGFIISIIYAISSQSLEIYGVLQTIASIMAMSVIIGALFVAPVLLLVAEGIGLVCECKSIQMESIRIFDLITFFIGGFYEDVYLSLYKDITAFDWEEQLYNGSRHTPIYSKAAVTVFVIFLIAVIGYFLLQYLHLDKTPPLVAVLSMSAVYLGVIQLIVFTIQVFEFNKSSSDYIDLYLLILPACSVLMTARTILQKIHEWNAMNIETEKMNTAAKIMKSAKLWPVFALLLMLPLLGVIIMILLLFGQAPDSIVKAWTETSDWALSQRQGPPNLYYDEHYLCTVAAGGHRRIVKPIRKGIRHGHEVIVNRQLCIANAFEEVLQEKTPHFHKALRNFYDRYGFPIAKLIRKKWQADIVYVLMKPLEWLFLLVLYSTDVHPENRIAVQYMGKVPEYRH